MKGGIYKITNPKEEVYIGRTKNFNQRYDLYSRYSTLPPQPKLFNSFDKFGFKNHQIEILKYTTDPTKEAEYIKEYNSYKKGLNSNKGGGGPVEHNSQTRKLISKAGRKNVGKRKTSHWKGKKRPKEFGEKLSKDRKNIPLLKNRKPILQYDKKGNFIKEHDSIELAAKYVNGNPTAINNALRKGGGATSSSYIWKYKNNNK